MGKRDTRNQWASKKRIVVIKGNLYKKEVGLRGGSLEKEKKKKRGNLREI